MEQDAIKTALELPLDLNALMDTEKTKMPIATLSVETISWFHLNLAMMELQANYQVVTVIAAELKMDGLALEVHLFEEGIQVQETSKIFLLVNAKKFVEME